MNGQAGEGTSLLSVPPAHSLAVHIYLTFRGNIRQKKVKPHSSVSTVGMFIEPSAKH